MPTNGVVELKISGGGYGGDFVLLPNGDLALSVDTEDAAPATQERLARYALTNPRQIDAYGNPISRGDHPAYQDFGAGLGTYIGTQASSTTINNMRAALSEQVDGDPYIQQDPSPAIDFSVDQSTQEMISVSVTVVTTTGTAVITDAIPLRQGV